MEINAVNEIWPELIQKTIEPPQTITETVERLLTVLDDEHKVAIAAMPHEFLLVRHETFLQSPLSGRKFS